MRVFVTGASGYIGGAVAAVLVRAGHRVRGLVRDPAKAAAVAACGIVPVIGSLEHTPLLAAEARAADATVNAADSDHATAAATLLVACAGRRLLHTSGISLHSDDAGGERGGTIHDETTTFPPHPDKAARAAIDASILAAAEGGEAFAVIRNPLIFGDPLGPPAASVQLPTLATTARRLGRPRHVGPGRNIWSYAALTDIVTLYRLLLARGERGLFYAEFGRGRLRHPDERHRQGAGPGAAASLEHRGSRGRMGRAARPSHLRLELPRTRSPRPGAGLAAEGRIAGSLDRSRHNSVKSRNLAPATPQGSRAPDLGHHTEKYLARGLRITIALVLCSGCSCHSSESDTPIRSAPRRRRIGACSSSLGQAG